MARIRRALLSVTDKSGLPEFARGLAQLGIELLSTGGTARLLRQQGLTVTEVSEVTGFPEMLEGRVKTLHPAVHGGLLARRDHPEHMAAIEAHGIRPIDMVVVNLYQFEQAARRGAPLDELIENIDIGGPSMIRSAAKNFRDVAVVVSPADYHWVLEEMKQSGGELSLVSLWKLAQAAFAATAAYDAAIASALGAIAEASPGAVLPAAPPALPDRQVLSLEKVAGLRYGENPHQQAALYRLAGRTPAGTAGARQLQGRELSYNNLVDLDAAWELVMEFDEHAAAIIKHTNPCGAATAAAQAEAYRRALATDPVSAYGGVLGFNREMQEDTAEEVAKLFVEAIIAPGYSPGALRRLAGRRNLRLLQMVDYERVRDEVQWKRISGGFLAQTKDHRPISPADLRVATKRAPTEEEVRALLFAWKIVKHVKSNAIVYAREGQLVGVGAGQMSRVDSVRLGAQKAHLPLAGTVLASDALFPFADGIEEGAKAGITAVIQPGGSVRDQEVIEAADRHNLAMVFTGVRHFRH
jgi:phosphoribosylaminoimidazolecarboxamide formyltransferase/IMP cyclohydrolase